MAPIKKEKLLSIEGDIFPYTMIYSRRAKYLRLQVSIDNLLEVIIPLKAKYPPVNKFISSNKDWIIRHCLNRQNSQKTYRYLGQKISVEQQFHLFSNENYLYFKRNKLLISSSNYSDKNIDQIYEGWLKERACEYIPSRVKELADKYGFNYNKVDVKSQKTRWGSCSNKRNLSFNYKLLYFNVEVIDYVIVHELCHLKQMNHSYKFWKLVEEILPNYNSLKYQLKEKKNSL